MKVGIRSIALAAALLAMLAPGCERLTLAKEVREHVNRVKAEVARDPSRIDAPDADGQPPLHRAVIDGQLFFVLWLADHGAALNLPNARGEAPLHLAAITDQTDDAEIVRTLIERGAALDVGDGEGTRPLHVAAGFSRVVVVRALLDGGADPKALNVRKETPLHLAATPQPNRSEADRRTIVALLVEHGAGVDARDAFGRTPLFMAAMAGHRDVVQALLARGAAIDFEGPDGFTPLQVAAVAGHAPVVEELLARGADPKHLDGNSGTPLAAVNERLATQAAPPEGLSARWLRVAEILRAHETREAAAQ